MYPALREDVQEWLTTNEVQAYLDIRPIWSSATSTITISDPKWAVLFKLTWL